MSNGLHAYLAMYGTDGALRAALVPIDAAATIASIDVDCSEAHVLTTRTSGCDATVRGLRLTLDGSIRSDTGDVAIGGASTVQGRWRGDHWALVATPSCAARPPFVTTLASDGALGMASDLTIASDHTRLVLVTSEVEDWSMLIQSATRELACRNHADQSRAQRLRVFRARAPLSLALMSRDDSRHGGHRRREIMTPRLAQHPHRVVHALHGDARHRVRNSGGISCDLAGSTVSS